MKANLSVFLSYPCGNWINEEAEKRKPQARLNNALKFRVWIYIAEMMPKITEGNNQQWEIQPHDQERAKQLWNVPLAAHWEMMKLKNPDSLSLIKSKMKNPRSRWWSTKRWSRAPTSSVKTNLRLPMHRQIDELKPMMKTGTNETKMRMKISVARIGRNPKPHGRRNKRGEGSDTIILNEIWFSFQKIPFGMNLIYTEVTNRAWAFMGLNQQEGHNQWHY